MMKIAMINGSPKGKNGTSGRIIETLCNRLSDIPQHVVRELAEQNAAEIVSTIRDSDAIIFVFPLYVDAIPSGLVRFLDEEQNAIALAAPNAKVYAVVNNGFYDARQNAIAIDMVEIFCERSGLVWGQGLGSCGGMIGETPSWDRFPLKKLGMALDALAKNIRNLDGAENCFVDPSIPRFLYMLAGNFFMKREMKKRNKTT
jgi:multimeric flavodoxin WrbA